MDGIKLFNVAWAINTAGPSPYMNERTELFLFGCVKAKEGNPCKGCFNPATWDSSVVEHTHDPEKMAEHIYRHAPNRYITIGGGEPTDQFENLIKLCEGLQRRGMHVIVYTWRSLKDALSGVYGNQQRDWFRKLLSNIDVLIDGEYHPEERLYDEECGDGTYNSIGSGNQIVWDVADYHTSGTALIKGYSLRDIAGLHLKHTENTWEDVLIYILKDDNCKFLSVNLLDSVVAQK